MRRRLQSDGYDPSQVPPSVDPDHTFDPAAATSVRGGSRVGRANATVPLIELRFDADWAHLGGAARLFGGPAPVWVDRSVVTGVRRIKRGVRFDSVDGRYDGVIFWTFDPTAVLDSLANHGWPVVDGASSPTEPNPS